jgi:chemotaxis protein CheZ
LENAIVSSRASRRRTAASSSRAKFVEERLDRMIGVWGGLDAFKELAGEQRHERLPGERALLNGPRLADDAGHVTQDDIDALFN